MPHKPVVAGLVFGCSLVAALGGSATGVLNTAPHATSVTVVLPPDPQRAVAKVLPSRPKHGKVLRGVASWYGGPVFHVTANGERFRPNTLAAASRTLPFNTHVRVTNLRNGRSVVVRINDRGPYVRGRVIDLTPKAAARLHMKHNGIAPVYIEIVRYETPSAAVNAVAVAH
ncbi:MAG: septal ring lytic transglycosylase RlpA family protein [Alphaproteobacteria bacterium]|nr:septal ring lytic transglycosylase RlpA family protein [Alphaproteobacteria bacterium]